MEPFQPYNSLLASQFSQLSAAQLQKLFDSSPDVICAFDREGYFLQVSKAAIQVWGYTPEELIGRRFQELVAPADLLFTEAAANLIMKGVNMTDFENRFIRKDDTPVPLLWSAHWDPKEETMFCIARDASELKAKERHQAKLDLDIRQRNTEMTEMLERITDGFFAMDTNWHIVYANRQVEKMLAIRREDYLTRNFWECFPSMVETEYYYQYHKAMNTKESVHFDAYFPPFEKWFTINAYPSQTGLSIFFKDITSQKRAEEELKSWHERFRLAAKADAIYDWDLQTNKLQWGEGLLEIFGYHSDELQMKQWENLLHPADREKTARALEHTLADPSASFWESEYRIKKKDHTYCHVLEKGYVMRDEKGKALRMVGKMQDVTEKRKAEEERRRYGQKLREQNELMMEVLEQMGDGFVAIGWDGKILYWNAAEEEISGIPRKAVLGKIVWETYPQLKQTEYYTLYQQFLKDPQPVHKQFFSPFSQKWVEIHAFAAKKGISLFIRDISEKKKIEEEVRKLSLIAKETVNAVVLSNQQQQIVWVNKAFTQLTGFTAEEAVGKQLGEVFDGPQTDIDLINYTKKCFKNCTPFRIEVLNYKKNRETYWADVSSQPLFDEGGNLEFFFSISTDITERKKLEEELLTQQKKMNTAVIAAQEKERAQIGLELHDNVNQVLTTVKLYTELCRDGVGDGKEMMNKSISLLQTSINEIRSLSKRLSAPTLGSIKLKDSIKELIEAVTATGKIDVKLEINSIEGLEVPQELHLAVYRILQEHFTNILKHAGAKKVEVTIDNWFNTLTLQITDDGKGFNTSEKRSGIGLTNMQSRAESLRGSLLLVSAPNQGCTLLARFPLES